MIIFCYFQKKMNLVLGVAHAGPVFAQNYQNLGISRVIDDFGVKRCHLAWWWCKLCLLLGRRKILIGQHMVLRCKRIQKPWWIFSRFSQIFMEFYGSKVHPQFALLHGNLINSISMKLSIFKSCTNFFSELQHLCKITYRYCFDFLTYLMEISKKNPE